MLEFPGGFLLHSGLPNPGLRTAIRRYARRWADSSLPVIVHLIAAAPDETGRMVQALEGLENILAVELGFPHDAASDWVTAATQAATGELPIIVSLVSEQALTIGAPAIDAGAAALSLAQPRGALTTDNSSLLTGRLYGPGLFPQTLETVRRLAGEGIPIVGAGGVYKREQAEALLDAGALGVQVGAILWKNASALSSTK
ncbi:MAG: hypothetical protein GXP40_13635 [Chloroflexi bacterium]|nr:hypothetical protein [Chloroflexota bacterium]